MIIMKKMRMMIKKYITEFIYNIFCSQMYYDDDYDVEIKHLYIYAVHIVLYTFFFDFYKNVTFTSGIVGRVLFVRETT